MTAKQLQLDSELFKALQIISSDESMMEKAVKALKRIANQRPASDETEYIMSSPEMMSILKKEQQNIEQGKGTPVSLEELWT